MPAYLLFGVIPASSDSQETFRGTSSVTTFSISSLTRLERFSTSSSKASNTSSSCTCIIRRLFSFCSFSLLTSEIMAILNEVGSRALDWGIHSSPPRKFPEVMVFAVYVRYGPDSPEYSSDKTLFPGFAEYVVGPFPDTAVPFEILLYEPLGLLPGYAEALCQAEGALAVNNAEINNLGPSPQLSFINARFSSETSSAVLW